MQSSKLGAMLRRFAGVSSDSPDKRPFRGFGEQLFGVAPLAVSGECAALTELSANNTRSPRRRSVNT